MQGKEYLHEALEQDRKVTRKLEQLERLQSMADKATSVIKDMPGAPQRNTSSREVLLVKLIDLKHEINQEIDKLVDMKRERSKIIEQIEQPEYQDILIFRYLLALKWEDVASRIDRSISYTYKLHGWALQELDKILEKKIKR